MGTCEGRVGWLCLILPIYAEMVAIDLYTTQGAEMVSGMIYVKALSHWASDRAPTLPTQKIGKSAVKSWHNRGERGGVLLETYIVVA